MCIRDRCKSDPDGLSLGENVVVIGGGNTAMDAARAAVRAPGVKKVRLVYRRSRRYMPADEEELALALSDGVEFCELLAPAGVRDGVLKCEKMVLGAPDASGRRSPVPTGETAEVPADTVIALSLIHISSGGVLAFARGLGEFGATAMIAGNIAGKTRTLPLAIYSAVAAGDMAGAYDYVAIIVMISLLAVISMNWFASRESRYRRKGAKR